MVCCSVDCAVGQFKCKTGGGCVPEEQRCDGVEHCADLSDEWNCLRIQEEDNRSTTSNHLQVSGCRTQGLMTTVDWDKVYKLVFQVLSNGTWLNVCGEKWNKTHSDIACQSLGYVSAVTENFVKKDENETKFYRLKPSGPNDSGLLSSLEETEDCESTVSLTCQDFSKCYIFPVRK